MEIGEGFLTTTEVARIMRVHRTTVVDWVNAGSLRAVRVPGQKTLRIPVEALRDLIDGCTDPADRVAEDLVQWLAKHEKEFASDLCPRCAVRGVDPKSSVGWCIGCTNEFLIAEDEKKERERARKLRWWDQNGNEWRHKRKAAEKAKKAAEAAALVESEEVQSA